MLSSAKRPLQQCACLTRALVRSSPVSRQVVIARKFSSSVRRNNDDLPWFVDPATAPASSSSSSNANATLATAPVPTRPPAHLSRPLHPLHDHLSVSPFFDKDSLTYIHAREADPMGSWCDWVVICTLREGRERGLRGAVEGVRTFLAANPVEFDADEADLASASNPSPFSPPATHPAIHGLPPTTASKHARSRARKGPPPTRQDQASGWALLDAGTLVVHVMTRDARKEFGDEIERVWRGVAKDEGVVTKRDQLEALERERQLQDNMRQVEEEMRAEELEAENEKESRIVACDVTDVSSLAVPWTVPSPLAPLYAYFPLLTVSNDDDATTPAPTKPTLWVLGPPPSGHKESLDPSSRRVQALARFSNVDFDSRYLADGLGAPGGTLPSLHLPQGDLVETDRVDESILKLATTKPAASDDDDSNNKGDGGGDRSPAAADPVVQAYTSLVETTLLPAVVAAVYLVAASTPSVTPALSRPFLSDLAHRWLGIAQRRDLISDVKRLRGGKTGKDVVLDLEEVERDAVEALEALEDKFSQQDKDARWFLGAATPSPLDASIYSLLTIISILPAKGDNGVLRTTLERCPTLTRWYKSHEQ
ncbi:hypothetical protein JCM3766R1_004998 [Sporobolomyces carnicolor]